MTHSPWTSDYVGLPYSLGDGECAHRAALVWRQRFGVEVEVAPAFGDMARAQELIAAHLGGGDWSPVGHPLEGDAVLMRKGDLVCHVGVWVASGHVLHCTRARGMVVSAPEDLPGEGFHVAGCFRHHAMEMPLALAA